MSAKWAAGLLLVQACVLPASAVRAAQNRAYVFGCTGQIAKVELSSRITTAVKDLTVLGWAPAVRDGCVIYSLTYQAASNSVFAVVAKESAAGAEGLGRYAVLQWNADDWTLLRRIEFENALSSIPNLLVSPDGADVFVAYEQSGTSGMAAINSATVSAPVNLTALKAGPWFSATATIGPEGTILDGQNVLRRTGAKWESHQLQPPGGAGFLRLDVNASADVFYVRAGKNTLVRAVNVARGRVTSSQLAGRFRPNELTPTPDGKAIVAIPQTRGAAVLWDVTSGRAIATTPVPPSNARRTLCVAADESAIIRSGNRLYVLSRRQSGAITSSIGIDLMTGCAFAP